MVHLATPRFSQLALLSFTALLKSNSTNHLSPSTCFTFIYFILKVISTPSRGLELMTLEIKSQMVHQMIQPGIPFCFIFFSHSTQYLLRYQRTYLCLLFPHHQNVTSIRAKILVCAVQWCKLCPEQPGTPQVGKCLLKKMLMIKYLTKSVKFSISYIILKSRFCFCF